MEITDLVLGLAAGVGIDLAPDEKHAYYVEWSLGEVNRVDTGTGQVSGVRAGLKLPQDVEVDWSTGDMFVSERIGRVLRFQGVEKTGEYTVPGAPHQLALVEEGGKRFLYTVCFDGGTLERIDIDAGTVTTVLGGFGHPIGLAVDPGQKLAWVSEQDLGVVTLVDLGAAAKVRTVAAGLVTPFFLAWSTDRKSLYCPQRVPANLVVFPPDGSAAPSVVVTGIDHQPSGVAVAGDGRIYVTTDRKIQIIAPKKVVLPPPPASPVIIESITFRYDGSPALPVTRTLHGAAVSTPEWVLGGTSEPVAYLGGVRPTIEVVLRKHNVTGNDFVIGATGTNAGIRRRQLAPVFDGSGRATHRFDFLWPLDPSVDVGDLHLDWYARDVGIGVTVNAGTTVNRTYRTLSYATDPWKGPLWSEALEIACRWARWTRTLDDAAGLVTEGYYRCGRLTYDVVRGATFYANGQFDIQSMIDRLNGGVGAGEFVNCTDSATTVSTLANLLGADLWQSKMGWTSSFTLNEIIAIGGTSFGFPNWGAGFSYHEVAWKDGCDVNDAVFDGCLQVDADSDPTSAPRTPLLPKNLRFGDCSTMDYRLRLSPPGADGCTSCQPQPATRQRRALY